jgi:hypothetical protein
VNIINGKWSVPVVISTKDNIGDKFDIIAVLADQKARAEFTSYIVERNLYNTLPGLDKIPNGATIYDKVTVGTILKEERPIVIPSLIQIFVYICSAIEILDAIITFIGASMTIKKLF